MPVRNAAARLASVPQVFLLDLDYRPGPNLLSREIRRTLRPGATATLKFDWIAGARVGNLRPP